MFYGGDTKFSYTACQWIETETIKIGKQIYDKMYGHGGERMVRVWVLMIKAKKYLHCSWLVVINLRPTQYTSFTDTISMDIRVQRTVPKDMIYIDTCKIDWLIANNGYDTKYNLVLIWKCEKPILKKVQFTPYPHFIVYDFEAILSPLNEHPIDNLTYLTGHTPVRVSIHDTLN